MPECLSFGIGSGAASIIELRHLGIAQPDDWTFSAFSRIETAGDGVRKGFGFGVATWSWDTLPQGTIQKFLDFITANEASAIVYISTPIDTGGSAQTFDEFSAVMDRVTDGQGKSHIARTQRPAVFDSVTISFTHLVEV